MTANKQIELVSEELTGIRSLVEEGYAPKVQQIELEKELNQIVARKNEATSNLKQTEQSIEELKFRLKAAKERLRLLVGIFVGKISRQCLRAGCGFKDAVHWSGCSPCRKDYGFSSERRDVTNRNRDYAKLD